MGHAYGAATPSTAAASAAAAAAAAVAAAAAGERGEDCLADVLPMPGPEEDPDLGLPQDFISQFP